MYLEELLTTASDSLTPGKTYTATYNTGKILAVSSDKILQSLRGELLQDMDILSVERPLFSPRYSIIFSPKLRAKMSYFLDLVYHAWYAMGYPDAIFVQMETGEESSNPGGILVWFFYSNKNNSH